MKVEGRKGKYREKKCVTKGKEKCLIGKKENKERKLGGGGT